MIDLRKTSGLPVKLDEKAFKLVFKDTLPQALPAIRTIQEMKEVLLDKSVATPKELYFMYRGVSLLKDSPKIEKNNLRYDITVIRGGLLGKEFMKTAGHYHPGLFPELYEVLHGEAWCLLQKSSPEDFQIITDTILVKAKLGEKIVCLPGYGHILINPSLSKALVTANWVSNQFSSDYSLYQKAGGAAYFFEKVNAEIKISKNNFFKQISEIRNVIPNPKIETFGLKKGKPIYELLKNVEKLKFLNQPKEFDFRDCFREL
ncbi:MAG: glucose-6-phosphate isomerase family protein [Candidatus Omnitrophota bacterium]|nr:glucose-6-phosphate isomerase family protein [Candidatus Omnitrophota bacterium]